MQRGSQPPTFVRVVRWNRRDTHNGSMENVLLDRAPVRLRRPARLLRLASDERLVALVRVGDEGAFEAIYDRHHPAILGFCRHMLGTREEAEDAVQHTFLAAFRDLVRHEKQVELRPWLFAIARNRCFSLLRARRAHVAIELAEPTTDALVATVEHREDLRELLMDLARLPEDQRAALLLAELGALDHAEIATVLGCPREKVKALVFQARTALAASREARATPCDEIRLELATASGAALRRGALRRHLHDCDGCRAFKAEVATQRKLFALALPVASSLALKGSVLSGVFGGASTSSAGAAGVAGATAGAAASASGGTFGGMLGTVASTGAGKLGVSLAVAAAVAGGGSTLTEQLQRHPASSPPSSSAAAGSRVPAGTSRPALLPGAPSSRGPGQVRQAAGRPERRGPAGGSTTAASGETHATHMLVPAPPHQQHERSHPVFEAPASGGEGATPPGQGGAPPPGQGGTPPGQGGTPPGQGGTPPGQGGTPPGQGGTPPGQGGTPPGQGGTPPPGQGGTPPGQGGTPPGQGGAPPPGHAKGNGPSTTPPGHGGTPPGQSKSGAPPENRY